MLGSLAKVLTLIVVSLAASSVSVARGEELFEKTSFPTDGRSVAARIVELNGDGRADVFVVVLKGIPPEEQRTIRVYLQRDDGSFAATPDHTLPVPRWSAVYDIADVRKDSPGAEMLLLRPDRITILSLADGSGRHWDLPVPGPTTLGVAEDERGFEPFRIAFYDFGPEPWLLVPQIGQLSAISTEGELLARLDIPRRANFFILPSTGLLSIESDFQVFLDAPKLSLGDVNGDARIDIISSTRHEIRVFLRREDGSYRFEPDRRLALGLVTPRDHIRASGGVTSAPGDIDGDGRLDLLISHIQGSFTDATATSYVYMNRDDGWKLGAPDQIFHSDASLSSDALFDLDGNGKLELLRIELSFSVLEMIELLLSREIDINISARRFVAGKGFSEKPYFKKKLSLPFSFETFRLKGFIPSADVDLNGDGFLDFVSSGGGKELEVFLGGPKGPFEQRSIQQKMPTAGVIDFADYDHDSLLDFVIYDPHNFDVPVNLWRNLGALPGSPAIIRPHADSQ